MEYLKNNAVLQCDSGLIPSLLTVTTNSKIAARDGIFATINDNLGGQNIKSFGLCSKCGICKIEGITLNWVNPVSKVKIMGYMALTSKSELICPKGGIIKCLNSGQF